MNFYDNPEKINEYEKMCESYDGKELYDILNKYLNKSSKILELGSGPGNDIKYFTKHFNATGSDLSEEFLQRCRNKFKNTPFLKLDAVSIDTNHKYDAIFSNKVLHHLKTSELELSLKRQTEVINKNGFLAHTFWIGDKEFTMEDVLFIFYKKENLLNLISKYFIIEETFCYKEFEENDSIFVIAKNSLAN